MYEFPDYNLPVLTERKKGVWVESQTEAVGVECPFCRTWSHIAGPKCLNNRCGAELHGVKHTRPSMLVACSTSYMRAAV